MTPEKGIPPEHRPLLSSISLPDLSGKDEKSSISPTISAAFGKLSNVRASVETVVKKQAALQRIVLPYPRMLECMWAFENMLQLGLETKGQPQLGMRVFFETGTGKTTSARQHALLKQATAATGTIPVLLASLSTKGTAKQLYVSIMSALGDGFAMAGTETTLRLRTMKALREKGVQLLILDEAHHPGRSGFSGDITAELKLMLDMGELPIVLLGTDEAVPIIGADKELAGRLMAPCRLGSLDWAMEDERGLWTEFLASLDQEMVREGISRELVGIADPDVAEALNTTCGGVIGRIMRIMLTAIPLAANDGRDSIDLEDVAEAVDRWSIEHGFATENPLNVLLG
ncbi:TniB family NTP-binding protein [Qipengyuania flava]|uniref:TniB family NTP-binding protein n=1 Tax=Qipengyuania flava TaxID=192812 RepID=UPI001CFE1D8F|nr:TniB family NTP-binding protein [Qipengyuania flava]